MIPAHLQKFVVEQDYSRYTPIDQAVWRFIMRQLRSYLREHAHDCYIEGLEKTGIEIDHIPRIETISSHISKFGWKAVAVSGFIPPAAFMELQSLSYLPIASDMRTIDHLLYTPAPDIVHEAAGHAPILVEPAFAEYLKRYAAVARNAIANHRDMEQYDAIRVLSDLKEHPSSTAKQIAAAEARVTAVTASMGEPSEAALLGRMNWWTAEYGLIGSLEKPRIFGAGLLSSVGEARSCLSAKVRKIPLTIDCIDSAYDITERQPHLFVTPDFETLSTVLDQLANRMAFRIGGRRALERALAAKTVNTVELESGLQISGLLKRIDGADEDVTYLQFEGPTQLSSRRHELREQGRKRHAQGFGSPLGLIGGRELSSHSLADFQLVADERAQLKFDSGVVVDGVFVSSLSSVSGKLMVLTFRECRVSRGSEILFDPAWGEFDMAVGARVVSVFGGPADRASYGETESFTPAVIPRRHYNAREQARHAVYAEIRAIREAGKSTAIDSRLSEVLKTLDREFSEEWLPRLEILEVAEKHQIKTPWVSDLRIELEARANDDSVPELPLRDGLRLL